MKRAVFHFGLETGSLRLLLHTTLAKGSVAARHRAEWPRDFRLLSIGRALPLETRRYVPAVINAMQSMGNESAFVAPLRNPGLTWILYAETTMATSQIDFGKRKEN